MIERKATTGVYLSTFWRFVFYGSGEMNFKLFDLDLEIMSNPQFADWLYACRNEVKR